METKALASKLARHYGTRDPFSIVTSLGYIVIETPLEGVRGFYQYIHRCHVVYLDSNLPEQERPWVCAHELGHSLLHKSMNKIFMDTHTCMVTSKYERDADHFAADLIFDDYDLQGFLGCSISTVAECLGINQSIAKYRMSTVKRL